MSCPSPGNLPNLGIKSLSLSSLALAGRFFTTSAIWEALGIRSRDYQNIRRNLLLILVIITLDGRDEE